MGAALYGLIGLIAASLLTLIGVLRAGQAPTHLADVTGLQVLAEELRKDRDDLRAQNLAGKTEAAQLREEITALRGEITGLRGEVHCLREALAGGGDTDGC